MRTLALLAAGALAGTLTTAIPVSATEPERDEIPVTVIVRTEYADKLRRKMDDPNVRVTHIRMCRQKPHGGYNPGSRKCSSVPVVDASRTPAQ